jgi:hypothetical protein
VTALPDATLVTAFPPNVTDRVVVVVAGACAKAACPSAHIATASAPGMADNIFLLRLWRRMGRSEEAGMRENADRENVCTKDNSWNNFSLDRLLLVLCSTNSEQAGIRMSATDANSQH